MLVDLERAEIRSRPPLGTISPNHKRNIQGKLKTDMKDEFICELYSARASISQCVVNTCLSPVSSAIPKLVIECGSSLARNLLCKDAIESHEVILQPTLPGYRRAEHDSNGLRTVPRPPVEECRKRMAKDCGSVTRR